MNRICDLFSIRYPIIQGGMIWCSGWELASAVSNAGGLGLIGSGSMSPDILRMHIEKCKQATDKPFGVNIPLIFKFSEEFISICKEEKVPVVFTSAGSPAKYTSVLKEAGVKVAHVVAGSRFALKAEAAGVDAVVAEGFEAGGHNGPDETTTMTLIPAVRKAIHIPLIAAGGISGGGAMLAAMSLGAEGVQIGTRFAATQESSAHPSFKEKILAAGEGDTRLTLKKLMPVRLLKNHFFSEVHEAELRGAGTEELSELLGRGRARMGMFEGDIENGELEIGQTSALIDDIPPAAEVMQRIMQEYAEARKKICGPESDFS